MRNERNVTIGTPSTPTFTICSNARARLGPFQDLRAQVAQCQHARGLASGEDVEFQGIRVISKSVAAASLLHRGSEGACKDEGGSNLLRRALFTSLVFL